MNYSLLVTGLQVNYVCKYILVLLPFFPSTVCVQLMIGLHYLIVLVRLTDDPFIVFV
jgi:hypothetical protein